MAFLEVCETHFKLCIDLWLQVNWMSVWANFTSIIVEVFTRFPEKSRSLDNETGRFLQTAKKL